MTNTSELPSMVTELNPNAPMPVPLWFVAVTFVGFVWLYTKFGWVPLGSLAIPVPYLIYFTVMGTIAAVLASFRMHERSDDDG